MKYVQALYAKQLGMRFSEINIIDKSIDWLTKEYEMQSLFIKFTKDNVQKECFFKIFEGQEQSENMKVN